MKQVLIYLFAILSGVGLGHFLVVPVFLYLTAPPPPLLQGEYLLSTKDKVTTETLGGCEYLLLRDSITHKGNCSNPNHLRGGALLEDWSSR